MSIRYYLFLTLLSSATCVLVPLNVKSTVIKLTVSVLDLDVVDLGKGPVRRWTKNPLLSEIQPLGLLPYDDGSSNFGDLVHLRKGRRDELIFSEIFTNDPGSDSVTNLQWTGRFPGYMVTQVRVLNLGRQRAFCSFIRSGEALAEAGIYVPSNVNYRIWIDVYGRRI